MRLSPETWRCLMSHSRGSSGQRGKGESGGTRWKPGLSQKPIDLRSVLHAHLLFHGNSIIRACESMCGLSGCVKCSDPVTDESSLQLGL